MSIGERILLFLSRKPEANDYQEQTEETIETALDLLKRVYPEIGALVTGKRILDYGCGRGYQCIALVKEYDCSVVGVDTNRKTLNKAIENANYHDVSLQKLSFVESVTKDMLDSFDVLISQNSFEHFSDPKKTLADMGDLLNDSGTILLTFGPPWLAPYGSHMSFFCKIPWVNIFFPESVVMNVRSHFRNDGAKKYVDVESGLNKITIAKFESIVSSCGLETKSTKYECVKGINWVSKIPLIREFFINHVTTNLSKVAKQ